MAHEHACIIYLAFLKYELNLFFCYIRINNLVKIRIIEESFIYIIFNNKWKKNQQSITRIFDQDMKKCLDIYDSFGIIFSLVFADRTIIEVIATARIIAAIAPNSGTT